MKIFMYIITCVYLLISTVSLAVDSDQDFVSLKSWHQSTKEFAYNTLARVYYTTSVAGYGSDINFIHQFLHSYFEKKEWIDENYYQLLPSETEEMRKLLENYTFHKMAFKIPYLYKLTEKEVSIVLCFFRRTPFNIKKILFC